MRFRHAAAFASLAFTLQFLASAPAGATTVDTDRRFTQLAAEVVRDSAAARMAVAKNDTATARNDINDALKARDTMAGMAKSNGMTMVVPVYAELDDTSVLADTVNKRASKTNAGAANAPLTVRSSTADVTVFAIDLDKAKARLDAAQLALNDRNAQAAQDSLAAIGTDLVETSVAEHAPLLTARENLALAQGALKANDVATASADLRAASRSLDTYAAAHNDPDARRLASQIDAAVPVNARTQPSMMSKIDAWWGSVKDWFAHAA